MSWTAGDVSGSQTLTALDHLYAVHVNELRVAVDLKSDIGHTHTPSQVGLGNVPNVDATNRTNHTGTQLASTISDFTEAAQDAIGAALTNSSTLSFTYNDAGNTITAAVIESGLTIANIGGSVPASKMPAFTGDITTVAGAVATTIAANVVTNSKLAQMGANTIKGNNTAGTANALDLTASQVKTLLAISTSDVSGLAPIATSGSAADLSAGTILAARMPAHTGDVTSSAGSVATTIAANAVTNAKAAQMGANTFKGNNTGSTANAADLTVAQAKTLLAISTSDITGLAAIATSGSATDLSAGTVPAARFPAFTGDITTSAGAIATTLGSNVVTNAKAAQMATNTIKGNNTGSTANASDLTATQVTAMLNNVVGDSGSGGTKGMVPAPAAGDTAAGKFLSAAGTWSTPAGGGGGEANTASNVGTGGVGVFKQKTLVNLEFKNINAGSSKITVTNDTGNNEIDIDIAEANLTAFTGDSGSGGVKGLVPAPAAGDNNAGKYLKASGIFDKITGGGDGQIQFNDNDTQNGDSSFIINKSTKIVSMRGAVLQVSGANSSIPFTAIVDSSVASQNAANIENATNYAHTGQILRLRMRNATDSGTVFQIENEGTGSSTLWKRGGSTNASVDKNGNALFASLSLTTALPLTQGGTGATSATGATANLNAFVGDSGSGGVKGLVPAPASGDATKFLKGNGTWATVSGSGDTSTNTATSVVSEIALFADTSGKLLKRATGTGIATLTSGVLSATSTTGSGNVVLATSPSLAGLAITNTATISNDISLTFSGVGIYNGNSFKTGTDGTFLFDVGASNSVKIKGGDNAGATFFGYTDTSFNYVWKSASDGATTQSKGAIINSGSNSSNTQIKGSSDANLVTVDAANNRVGIGTATPAVKLDVSGDIAAAGKLYQNASPGDLYLFSQFR